MRRTLRALVLAALVCAVFNALAGADESAAGAAAAAATRLKRVDNGRCAASWQRAGGLCQERVDKDTWTQKVAAVRGPLGPLLSRKLVSISHRDEPARSARRPAGDDASQQFVSR